MPNAYDDSRNAIHLDDDAYTKTAAYSDMAARVGAGCAGDAVACETFCTGFYKFRRNTAGEGRHHGAVRNIFQSEGVFGAGVRIKRSVRRDEQFGGVQVSE